MPQTPPPNKDAYKAAGVDIEAGNRLVKTIGPLAAATRRAGTDAALGGFGGLFDLRAAGFTDPLLVAGTDGVGTKLLIAIATGAHDTIGIDLVAMCANDVLAQGAEPLFFLDYFACGKLEETVAARVIGGIAAGCAEAGCALIGGETAEMPGMYPAGHYDLAGFCVGAVERQAVLPRLNEMAAGDLLIAIPSSGPHANGFSLIRRIVADSGLDWEAPAPFAEGTLGAILLTPTRLYIRDTLPQIRAGRIKGLAHITGGGLEENVPRCLPAHLVPRYSADALALPPVFAWLMEKGGLSLREMHRTFNAGIGMVLVCAPASGPDILAAIPDARIIGDLANA